MTESQPQRDAVDPYPMTADTIAKARAQQQAERADVTRLTGVTFNPDGSMHLPNAIEGVGLALGKFLGAWLLQRADGTWN